MQIRYANARNVPFLAVSGHHGLDSAFADVKNGVGIWMRSMTDLKVLGDGESARIGGGIVTKDLVDKLWEKGKMTGKSVCNHFLEDGVHTYRDSYQLLVPANAPV